MEYIGDVRGRGYLIQAPPGPAPRQAGRGGSGRAAYHRNWASWASPAFLPAAAGIGGIVKGSTCARGRAMCLPGQTAILTTSSKLLHVCFSSI
jgi:hypothetical protein